MPPKCNQCGVWHEYDRFGNKVGKCRVRDIKNYLFQQFQEKLLKEEEQNAERE